MKVKDKIFYQVATDRNYKVGDILCFGEYLNGLGYRVQNSNFNDGKTPFHKLGFMYLDSKKIFKNKQLVLQMSKALLEADFVLRELAAEEVRKEKFSHLPSRLKCMFLSETKEETLKNFEKMKKNNPQKSFQAVAVKLNGEVFYAKEVGLQRNGLSYNDNQKVALMYWAQNQNSTECTKEILFEGQAEVLEIFRETKR